MPGDGVSLSTTLSQLGSVAKTQAKGMQQAQPVAPFSDQQDKQDELKVQRVQETKEQENRGVDPDADRPDKRQRRRHRRQRKLLEESAADDDGSTSDEADTEDRETLGKLIDLRV